MLPRARSGRQFVRSFLISPDVGENELDLCYFIRKTAVYAPGSWAGRRENFHSWLYFCLWQILFFYLIGVYWVVKLISRALGSFYVDCIVIYYLHKKWRKFIPRRLFIDINDFAVGIFIWESVWNSNLNLNQSVADIMYLCKLFQRVDILQVRDAVCFGVWYK